MKELCRKYFMSVEKFKPPFLMSSLSFSPFPPSPSCFGPWLIWQNTGSGLDDINATYWRTIFSFNLSIFFDLWTPLFLGIACIHMHVPALTGQGVWEKNQFVRNAFLYLFVALVANFGYAGNFGVLVGFVNVLASLFCFVASFGD